jgi:hypothetical protein
MMESAERGLISLPGSKSLETLQVWLVPSVRPRDRLSVPACRVGGPARSREDSAAGRHRAAGRPRGPCNLVASAPRQRDRQSQGSVRRTFKRNMAARRVLPRHEPDPGGKVAARSEDRRVWNLGRDPGGDNRADAGMVVSRRVAKSFLARATIPASIPMMRRALAGRRPSVSSATTATRLRPWLRPRGATMPNSAKWPRNALTSIVRCRTRRSWTPWATSAACCCGVLRQTGSVREGDRRLARAPVPLAQHDLLPLGVRQRRFCS